MYTFGGKQINSNFHRDKMGSRVGTDTVYCPLPALLLWPTKHHLISPSFLQGFSSWLTVNISRTSVPNSWILNMHTDDLIPGIPSLAGLSPPASATHSHAHTVVTHSPDGYLTTSLSSNPQHLHLPSPGLTLLPASVRKLRQPEEDFQRLFIHIYWGTDIDSHILYFSRHYCSWNPCSFLKASPPFLYQIPLLSSSFKEINCSRHSPLFLLKWNWNFPPYWVIPSSNQHSHMLLFLSSKKKTQTTFSWAYFIP